MVRYDIVEYGVMWYGVYRCVYLHARGLDSSVSVSRLLLLLLSQEHPVDSLSGETEWTEW